MTEQKKQGRERHREINLPGNAAAEFWLERLGDKIEPHHSFSSPHGSGSGGGGAWLRCSLHGCFGEALATGTCLVHSDAAARQEQLRRTAQSRQVLSLKGLALSQRIWDEIVASPIFVDGSPIVPMSFIAAEINATIRIDDGQLRHWLDFTGASVFAHIELRECTFSQALTARFGVFNGGALNCAGSKFLQDVDVSYSRAERGSFGFERCTFQGQFIADGIDGGLHLGKSTFEQTVSFKHAKGHLILNEARILGSIDLSHADCAGCNGEQLFAETATRFGPCKARSFYLPRATFLSRVHIDVTSEDDVNLSGAVLKEGGLIDVQSKSLQLSQVSIGGPLRVSGKPQATRLTEIRGGLLNSDVGQIAFARVDLSRCSFYGAHGLGNIDIESTVTFSRSPWWAGRRRYIADEFAWRAGARRFHSYGWEIEGVHVGAELPGRVKGEPQKILLPALDAAQVAAIYRELRRSLESKSDMPGAADFYYGEMEMRLWSAPPLERGLLWLYWLVSGYGMRAWRALLSWIALIALGTYLMTFDGFATDPYSIPRALLFATRATLPGVRTLEGLTPTGQAIEIGLRIFGPLTIALFLIAVRGKLMRKPSD